ncbi:MAG: HEAT repeat domain-containing protein [Bryobacteraceae bacterium]|jgi:HEAT repeat protein
MLLSRPLIACLLACACSLTAEPPATAQRVRTARELARQGSDAIPKLELMLRDSVTEVRVEAVKSIVAIDTAASLAPLIQATRDNDAEVQIRATDGLVNFYLPGYVGRGLSSSLRRVGNALKAHFTDTNEQTIGGYVQVRPEVIEALGKLARGGVSLEVRANAARAAGILRGQTAIPDLIEALHSKDDQLIYESLIALQKINDPSAAPRIEFLLRDLDEKVQLAAIETTGLLRNREALPQLRSALADAQSAKVRRAALTAMAMMPDPASRPIYERYLTDRDEGLRAAALEGLARLKDPADLPALEKIYAEEAKRPAQLAAAFGLVMLGRSQIAEFSPLQFLINTLNSVAWRGVARAYLIELARDPAIRRPLQEQVQGGTKDEKIELARILGVSGDRDAVPCLEALSHDADAEVGGAALEALRTLKARLP